METLNKPYCATIGFFDGVHRGHQYLIDRLADTARRNGQQSMVITFDRHPRQVVHADYVPQLITTPEEKLRLLRQTGADRIEVLHFDTCMAQLSARDFMQQVLHDRLGVATLLTGYDNRFGHNRAEGFDDYVRYGRAMHMSVVQTPPIDVDGMRVSSSLVRRKIAEGDIAAANECLGRRFAVGGTVRHGFEEGRKMGFPTANIQPDSPLQILPPDGVYAVRLSVEDGPWHTAMLNIGANPTFNRAQTTIEAHILDFNADIYGRHVRVEFVSRIRGERRFGSAGELKAQLVRDMACVRSLACT